MYISSTLPHLYVLRYCISCTHRYVVASCFMQTYVPKHSCVSVFVVFIYSQCHLNPNTMRSSPSNAVSWDIRALSLRTLLIIIPPEEHNHQPLSSFLLQPLRFSFLFNSSGPSPWPRGAMFCLSVNGGRVVRRSATEHCSLSEAARTFR